MSNKGIQEILNDSNLSKRSREILTDYDEHYERWQSYSVGVSSQEEAFALIRDLALKTGKSYEEITGDDLEQFFSKVPQGELIHKRTLIWNFYMSLYHSYTEDVPPTSVEETYAWLSNAHKDQIREMHL